MKKILLLLVALISALQASAQNVESMQNQSATVSIDSLSLRLNKLQHDYDFMYCDYELHKLLMDFKDLSNSIHISSNGVVINYYNTKYERALYESYLNNYEAYSFSLKSLKERNEVVRLVVLTKMWSSNFSDTEQNVIKTSLDAIQAAASTAESALNYYDAAIKAYKSKW